MLAPMPIQNAFCWKAQQSASRRKTFWSKAKSVRLTRAATGAAIGWSGSMKLDRGRIAYSALPDALTDVAFVGHADPTHLVIERFMGKCGSASLGVAFERAGWSENAPLAVSAKVIGLTIDDRFRAGLPETYARIWNRFRPKGIVD